MGFLMQIRRMPLIRNNARCLWRTDLWRSDLWRTACDAVIVDF